MTPREQKIEQIALIMGWNGTPGEDLEKTPGWPKGWSSNWTHPELAGTWNAPPRAQLVKQLVELLLA